ncbi:MAG: biotin/lipoyl-binding protein, partial [Pseudomonadota bacterium]|nr:biotin/lipoyl-binding protein [Pseudomonadota bacterium]
TLAPTLRLFGRVESPHKSTLSAAVEADVLETPVLEGQSVEQDQLLVRLDDADIRLVIAQRQAELVEIDAQSQSDRKKIESDRAALVRERELLRLTAKAVDRAQKLARTRAGAEAAVDEALQSLERQELAVEKRQKSIVELETHQLQLEARKQRGEAALAGAERDLERCVISAPFGGRITQVHVSPGDRVSRGKVLVELYDSGEMEVRVQVPDRYLAALQEVLAGGGKVTARLSSDNGQGQLLLHRFAAQVVHGQGGVDAFFRAADGALPELGRTVELEAELPPLQDVFGLPVDAFYGRQRVYKVVDGRLQAVEVQRVGERVENRQAIVLVRSGALAEGDRVMVSRLPQAVSGLRVEPFVEAAQ